MASGERRVFAPRGRKPRVAHYGRSQRQHAAVEKARRKAIRFVSSLRKIEMARSKGSNETRPLTVPTSKDREKYNKDYVDKHNDNAHIVAAKQHKRNVWIFCAFLPVVFYNICAPQFISVASHSLQAMVLLENHFSPLTGNKDRDTIAHCTRCGNTSTKVDHWEKEHGKFCKGHASKSSNVQSNQKKLQTSNAMQQQQKLNSSTS